MGSKIKIGLVQINNSYVNHSYFPYSVGMLQAFAQKYLERLDDFEFLLPIYSRIPVETAAESLKDASIVFFSVYTWNFQISLKIAKRVKEDNPEVIIVFGGPHVPSRKTEFFLRSNPFIDLACHGEGESIFVSILENYNSFDWSKVPSISYLDKAEKFFQTPAAARICELDKIPSPYLEGVFDRLIGTNPRLEWDVLWETNRGCPFLCSYCDWGSATKNRVYPHDTNKLFREIDWFSEKRIEFVFCCDANFGILERDIEIVKYFAENKGKYGYPKVLSAQTTKSFNEQSYKMYEIMSEAGLNKGLSLSLQSLNPDTLRDIGRRNMKIEEFKEIQQRLTSAKIETFTDIILGLPNETYDSFADGVSAVIESGQHNRIQFNNLSILPNAEMGDLEYQEKFGFDTVETKVLNMHGSLSTSDQTLETQQLVVGTKSISKSDWVKIRVFGWMTALLHFDKLLQVPFIVLNKTYPVSFRELIEIFTEAKELPPIFSDMHSFFINKAIDMQRGGSEFCESKEWLNIWWPADELILIKLATEGKLDKFYQEAKKLLSEYLQSRKIFDYQTILDEAIFLNQNLLKLPFQGQNKEIELSHNIWEVYQATLKGIDLLLKKEDSFYKIDCMSDRWPSWEDWCRKVVWYGNKKGAYICSCKASRPKIRQLEING